MKTLYSYSIGSIIKLKRVLFILFFLGLLFNNNVHAQNTDGDPIPNAIDLDDDNDGILDVDESCPVPIPEDFFIPLYHANIINAPDNKIFVTGQDSNPTTGNSNYFSFQEITPGSGDWASVSGTTIKLVGADNGDPQYVLLTSTGLYVWGSENELIATSVTSSTAIQSLPLPRNTTNSGEIDVSNITDITAGPGVLAIYTTDGRVYTRGSLENTSSEIRGANGTSADSNGWYTVQYNPGSGATDLVNVIDLDITEVGAFAILSTGEWYTWGPKASLGGNGSGSNAAALDIATEMTKPSDFLIGQSPIQIEMATGEWVAGSSPDLNPGDAASYFVLHPTNGKIYTMGGNSLGQLGINNSTDSHVADWNTVKVSGGSELTNVVFMAGQSYSIDNPEGAAITEVAGIRELYMWGSNNNQTLSDGSSDPQYFAGIPSYYSGAGNGVYADFNGDLAVNNLDRNPIRVGVGGHQSIYYDSYQKNYCFVGHNADGAFGYTVADAAKFSTGDPALRDTLIPGCDTDGDGIIDSLDLDSDNDGIYDAVEAGHGHPHTNGVVNGLVNATNGIPSLVDNGSGGVNYSLLNSDSAHPTNADSDFDWQDLDSDGDGCSDANEGYGVNTADGGDGGIYNPGNTATEPLSLVASTIDADGRVIAAGYSSPADLDINLTQDYLQLSGIDNVTNPNSVTTVITSSVNFNVTATTIGAGTIPLYQWQEDSGSGFVNISDNSIYSGTNTNSLDVNILDDSLDGNYYRIIVSTVSNVCDIEATNSTAALLSILTINAVNDDLSATKINGTAGGTTASVFANDDADGTTPATDALIDNNIAITNDGGLTGVTINNDGTIVIPAGTTEGTYTVTYSICLTANNTTCDTATVTIDVQTIDAVNDDLSATKINGTAGGTTASVFANDDADGTTPATDALIDNNIAITNDGGLTGVTINNDGTIVIPAGTTEGTYTVTYSICLTANNTICDTATVTIDVQIDSDLDGIIDAIDIDDDNDGISDLDESNGIDPSADDDNDGVPNYLDDEPSNPLVGDTNGSVEPAYDFDGDGIPNHFDIDADNDGILDVNEAGNGDLDTNNDGVIDSNDDGFSDTTDNGQADNTEGTTPTNTDSTGNANFLDIDADDDGIPDNVEAQLTSAYTVPANAFDTVGLDTNYPGGLTPVDTDEDGTPDYIDLDSDGDGIDDVIEAGQGTITNPNADADNDGLNDAFDDTPGNDVNNDLDTGAIATDNDDNPTTAEVDFREVADSDGDGVLDTTEEEDGTDPHNPCDYVITSATLPVSGDYLVADCDGDGVTNEQEIADGTNPEDPCDYDRFNVTLAQTGDYLISDCDGDGVLNETELMDATDPDDPCNFIATSITVERSGDYLVADCDGDTISNGQEIEDGTNPQDPCNHIDGRVPNGIACDIIFENDLVDPNITDGIFKITNIEAYPDNTVRIYNRWGVLVFETQGYNNGSNGFQGISNGRATIQQNEKLPVGIYYYVVDYMNLGQAKKKAGYLYINR